MIAWAIVEDVRQRRLTHFRLGWAYRFDFGGVACRAVVGAPKPWRHGVVREGLGCAHVHHFPSRGNDMFRALLITGAALAAATANAGDLRISFGEPRADR